MAFGGQWLGVGWPPFQCIAEPSPLPFALPTDHSAKRPFFFPTTQNCLETLCSTDVSYFVIRNLLLQGVVGNGKAFLACWPPLKSHTHEERMGHSPIIPAQRQLLPCIPRAAARRALQVLLCRRDLMPITPAHVALLRDCVHSALQGHDNEATPATMLTRGGFVKLLLDRRRDVGEERWSTELAVSW